MPGFQSTRLVTEGTLEPFFFLYADDSIQGNPETCKQSSIMLNYEVKNSKERGGRGEKAVYLIYIQFHQDKRCGDSIFLLTINKPLRISFRVDNLWAKG